ncbi:MAG: DJ-1/PfpI family protein [Candidatus Zixiibacteriota bacterium]|nr:MAG: DJ-1/PfpI family protein [candidate division Zixibacteria bacterium]
MRSKIFSGCQSAVMVSLLTITVNVLSGCSAPPVERISSGKNILGIVPHGFGINYYLLQDVMDQYGWDVTYAGNTDSVEVCGPFAAPRGGLAMGVDTLLSDITDIDAFDAVVLLTSTQFSGDDPYADILGSEHTMGLIASAAEKDLPVFTSCAGVRVLAALELINGLSVTGSKRFQAEFEAAGATFLGVDPAPQILGNLITSSRGQYNNVPNGVALSTLMEHREIPVATAVAMMDTTIGIGPVNFADAQSVWAHTYGGLDADGARDILQTEDGGFLIIGYTFSTGTGIADIMAVRTDDSGRMVWWNTYGGNGTEYG